MSDLKLSDIVFVPSVQHTGTFFAVEFLKNFFPRSKELTFLLEPDNTKPADANILYKMTYSKPLDQRVVMHVHLPIIRNISQEVNYSGTWFEQTWIQNIGTKRSLPVQTLLLICNFFKTVIPVRDPMAAILTRETRHPQFRHFFIVDGFVALAEEFARHPNVKFLPIDLFAGNVKKRAELLRDIVAHVGLNPAEHAGVINKWASSWEPKNITPGNPFKQMYEKRDLDALRKALGPKWSEVRYLRNMAFIILPFLLGLGYERKNLRF